MAGILANENPKAAVHSFLTICFSNRPGKGDMEYNTIYVNGGYQSTLTLKALEGQQWVGEVRADPKSAEKSAAQKVIDDHREMIETFAARREAEIAVADGNHAEPAFKKQRIDDRTGYICSDSNKNTLNGLVMNVLRSRSLLKQGDKPLVYDSCPLGEVIEGEEAASYQCTLTMPTMPGDYATMLFIGEECEKKKDAEQSAAGKALEALQADDEIMASVKDLPTKTKEEKSFFVQRRGHKGSERQGQRQDGCNDGYDVHRNERHDEGKQR